MRFSLQVAPSARVTALTSLGVAITFTGFPALSVVYPLDDVSLLTLGNVARDAAAGLGLPMETGTYPQQDLSGAFHVLTSAQVQKLYVRLRDYRRGLVLYALGYTKTLPAAPAAI
jgi:hypothetical protein